MRLARGLLMLPAAVLLAVALLAPSKALMAQQSESRYQVALVTVGPGELYFERFGHNALLVIDPASDQQVTYNYGIFDFQQEDFFLNFARGRMTYKLAAFPDAADIPYYIRSNRQVDLQTLDLSGPEVDRLLGHLMWNSEVGNATYRYHYFDDNCSTRIRDALDLALGGTLKLRFQPEAAAHNLRFHVNRLTRPQLWAYLGTHLALGREVDGPLTRWQEFFLPMEFRDALQDVKRPDGRPLVRQRTVLHEGGVAEPAAPPHWWPWFLLAGLIMAVIQWRLGPGRWSAVWWYVNGLVGAVLASLWLLTEHHSAHANENLLLFSPLALLAGLLISFGRVEAARVAAMLMMILAGLAVVLAATPWHAQANLEFVLFAVPVHVAGWLGLRRHA